MKEQNSVSQKNKRNSRAKLIASGRYNGSNRLLKDMGLSYQIFNTTAT